MQETTRHFFKTTRHFQQNDPSLSTKQPVTFNKTTRHFQQNNTLSMNISTFIV